ncbi:cytochrome P450 [Hymenopellis radicata]|nr:cytochrome P450 [Hymenopellis radicata]
MIHELLNDYRPEILLALGIVCFVLWKYSETRKLQHIPTYGSQIPLLSHWNGFRSLGRAKDILKDGCSVYKDQPFKVALPDGWRVVITNPELVEELRKAPEDTLSFDEAVNESLQIAYTLGPSIAENSYHIPVIRTVLNMKNLPSAFEEMNDEIIRALPDALPKHGRFALDFRIPQHMTMDIVARASNRVFVGLPLCRNPEYLEINKKFTLDVVATATVLKLFPEFMRPVVALAFPNVETSIRKVRGMVEPLVKEYNDHVQDLDTEFKDFDDRKPNQAFRIFADRLLDVASEEESSPDNISRRILALNFAALHTTSSTFTHALLHLAENPTYVEELRKEVEAVVHTSGWSLDSLKEMHKLGSFLAESHRVNAIGAVMMDRWVKKPFFFSDGTYLPAGTLVGVGVHSVHHDDHNYDSANEFNPWRFVPGADETTAPTIRMTKTSPTYLGFGHGKLACPGRFFAAMELHLMLAHVVLQYDVKYPDDEGRPENLWFGVSCIPNRNAKILLRKRETV